MRRHKPAVVVHHEGRPVPSEQQAEQAQVQMQVGAVDVEHVGPQRERLSPRGFAVADAGNDPQFRPQPFQFGPQVGGQQRFVFGNEGGDRHGRVSGMRIVASVPPSASAAGARSSDAAAPCNV